MGKNSKKSTNPVAKPKGSRSTALVVVEKQGKKRNLPGRTIVRASRGSKSLARTMDAPVAVNSPLPRSFIEFMPSAPGTLRVKGVENVGRITSSANFTLKENLSVNPLNQKLFPRLSAIANCFESWSVNSVGMEFRATCPTTLAGSLLAYFDYDPADVPSASDINVLNQQTKTSTAMWKSTAIRPETRVIHANRNTFYVQSGNSAQNGSVIDAAQVRQDYAGVFRWYASDGAASGTFAGYLFVDFDFTFHVMVPARAVSAAWSKPSSNTIDDNGTAFLPLCSQDSGVGLVGGKDDQATAAWYTAGGIAGYLDGARQIYEAGEWLLSLRSTADGATFMDAARRGGPGRHPATPGPRSPSDWVSVSTEPESAVVTIEKNVPIDPITGRPLDLKGNVRTPLAAGGFSLTLAAYDVTSGVIDPDFPVTVSGMTSAAYNQIVTYATTAAFEASNTWNMLVPAGKQYVVRPYIVTDSAAGSQRVFSDTSLTANVVSQNE